MSTLSKAHIVVGVVPGQPPAVVIEAARFAERFDAVLVCASVDASQYTVGRRGNGTTLATPIDPDLGTGNEVGVFDSRLLSSIAQTLRHRSVQWSTRALAGGPAQELARVAEAVDALMIIVGTRESGLRGSLHNFFNGSVAAQLAHRQHRPVVVIPLNPVGLEVALPWEKEE